MATKLYSPFFSARRRASAIIRLVGTFDLGSSNSRYVSGTQRNAKHRGVVVRQSGRPASHAYGAFHYIKPFQCIIYFCVSHLRYGLCTGDGGQRALCNIADLKIAPWQRLDSARSVYIILTYDFSRKFCFLHTFIATSPFCIVSAVARCSLRGLAGMLCQCATSRHVSSSEENVCGDVKALPLKKKRCNP